LTGREISGGVAAKKVGGEVYSMIMRWMNLGTLASAQVRVR
jgi:hypothetical protein